MRLEPVIMELERHENILIIGHQAILRCIYAYFMNYNHEDLPYIQIPLHTVIELTPKAYGCEEKRFKGNWKKKFVYIQDKISHYHIVDIEAVDTHRPKVKRSTSIRKLMPSLKLPAVGASGEIVRDPMSPIIPISPQLFPKSSNSSTTNSSTGGSKAPLTNLDLGDAYL